MDSLPEDVQDALDRNMLLSFERSIADSVRIDCRSDDEFQVYTPFYFEDGDGFVLFLYKDHASGLWVLADRGHTSMHISYDHEGFGAGEGHSIMIGFAVEKFGVSYHDGCLSIPILGTDFAAALFSMVMAIHTLTVLAGLEVFDGGPSLLRRLEQMSSEADDE